MRARNPSALRASTYAYARGLPGRRAQVLVVSSAPLEALPGETPTSFEVLCAAVAAYNMLYLGMGLICLALGVITMLPSALALGTAATLRDAGQVFAVLLGVAMIVFVPLWLNLRTLWYGGARPWAVALALLGNGIWLGLVFWIAADEKGAGNFLLWFAFAAGPHICALLLQLCVLSVWLNDREHARDSMV